MLLKYYKGSRALFCFLVYFQLKCPRETQMTSESFVPLGWVSFCIKEPDEKMLRRKQGGNYHSTAAAISLGFMSSLYRLTKIRRNNSKKNKTKQK